MSDELNVRSLDACANCLEYRYRHVEEKCPPPYTSTWCEWDYDFAPPETGEAKAFKEVFELGVKAGVEQACKVINELKKDAEKFGYIKGYVEGRAKLRGDANVTGK